MAGKDIQDTCLGLAGPRVTDYLCPYRARAEGQAGLYSKLSQVALSTNVYGTESEPIY